eukprot:gnl/Hemi2/13958_TR4747_c0_g1_i1.p1 gnl/Hemi2/13958_TR4747_c0_g1~~gnl/Hemi2/13958_TR4747_c0_g1_i1.p1  ORF type:complete len:347 (+),score=58.31 gnl/Hemi2/13958_TR4747_c0_g1_i1:339-1379(+)
MWGEADLMVNLINFLTQQPIPVTGAPQDPAPHLAWINKLNTQHKIEHATLAKSMLTIHLRLAASSPAIISVLQKYADDAHELLVDEGSDADVPTVFSIVNTHSISSVMSSLLAAMEELLEDTEWRIGQLKAWLLESRQEERMRFEEEVLARLSSIITVASKLADTRLGAQASDLFLRFLVHLYKLLSAGVKANLTHKQNPTRGFIKLVENVARLNSLVYVFLTNMQNRPAGEESAAKVAREARLIPSMIFGIEQYEGCLMKLSKQCKTDLLRNFKRSTARDFKLDAKVMSQLDKVKEEESDHEDDDEEEDDEDEDAGTARSNKPRPTAKRKLKQPAARPSKAPRYQ